MNKYAPKNQAAPSELEKYFRSATFIQSASNLGNCPTIAGPEIAFAGRSNAGKSSAINRITDNKKLAKTGKTPGRTQLINFFELKDGARLVDLPGYGFAKVSKEKKNNWQKHLLNYLEKRETLAGLVLVMDSRHPLQAFDQMMLNWVKTYSVPSLILLTKCDKLSKNEARKTYFQVEAHCKNIPNSTPIQFSSTSGTGLESCLKSIADTFRDFSATSEQKPS